jgi:hypothetical protein
LGQNGRSKNVCWEIIFEKLIQVEWGNFSMEEIMEQLLHLNRGNTSLCLLQFKSKENE